MMLAGRKRKRHNITKFNFGVAAKTDKPVSIKLPPNCPTFEIPSSFMDWDNNDLLLQRELFAGFTPTKHLYVDKARWEYMYSFINHCFTTRNCKNNSDGSKEKTMLCFYGPVREKKSKRQRMTHKNTTQRTTVCPVKAYMKTMVDGSVHLRFAGEHDHDLTAVDKLRYVLYFY